MQLLSFIELIKLQKYFIKERSYISTPEFGVSDHDAPRYERLSAFIEDIDTSIEIKFLEYSIDID